MSRVRVGCRSCLDQKLDNWLHDLDKTRVIANKIYCIPHYKIEVGI